MKIYRVETEDGIGPYQIRIPGSRKFKFNQLSLVHNNFQHPGAYEDFYPFGQRLAEDGWVSGFSSLAKYHKWFDKHALAIIKGHVFFSTYEVPRIYVFQSKSKKQVMFNRSQAILLDSKPLK